MADWDKLSGMNAASEDLEYHLGVLRGYMVHPEHYEKAVTYFLDEFAGDAKFLERSNADEAPHLRAVICHVVSRALDQPIRLDEWRAFLLREHRFFHGNGLVSGRVVLFFYLRDADTGIAALIPGAQGEMEVARFRLTSGLPDPRSN